MKVLKLIEKDEEKFKQYLIVSAIWTFLRLISLAQMEASYGYAGNIFPNHSWLYIRITTGNWLIGLIFIHSFQRYILNQNQINWPKTIVGFLLFSSISTLVFFSWSYTMYAVHNNGMFGLPLSMAGYSGMFSNIGPQTFHTVLLEIVLIVGLIFAVNTYTRKGNITIREAKANQMMSEAKLGQLKSQLQPHFLFNTLHALNSLMEQNVELAKNLLVDLSELLRSVLEFGDQDRITVGEELLLLDKYIQIEQTRFSDSLHITKHIANESLSCYLPIFILQPLVENSIKHGTKHQRDITCVEIRSAISNDNLVITIVDDGQGFSESIVYGTGLTNVTERLSTLYGSKASFSITKNSRGVINKITLPIQYE